MYPQLQTANREEMCLRGRFTTAGAGAPTVMRGAALLSISAPASSVYTLVFGGLTTDIPRIGQSITANAWILSSTAAATTLARVLTSSVSSGVLTVTIETQSAAGAAANLTGPEVCYEIIVSTAGADAADLR